MKYKIIFIDSQSLFTKVFERKNSVPTQLLLLASYLKHVQLKGRNDIGIEIHFIENEGLPNPKDITEYRKYIKELKEFLIKFNDGPRLIFGISAFSTMQYLDSVTIANTIRELYPDALITVGGYHANHRYEDFIFPKKIFGVNIKRKLFDYIFLGESEVRFGEFIQDILDGKLNDKSDQDTPTRVIRSGLIKNLDIIPPLDFSLFKYNKEDINSVVIFFSRGCPFNCNFCADYRKYQNEFKGHRFRSVSPQNAVNQFKSMVKFFEDRNLKTEYLIGDSVFAYPAWRMKFYQGLIEANIKDEIFVETHIDQMNVKKELPLLKHLNIDLAFGVESGSPRMLRLMNKSHNPENYLKRTKEIIKELDKIGIYVFANILIGHPGETNETLQESLNYFMSVSEEVSNMLPRFFKYLLLPGTENYINMEYYRKTFGTYYYYPEFWFLPRSTFYSSIQINPRASFTYRDVIKFGRPKIIDIIKESLRNLKLLKNREYKYQTLRSLLLIEQYPSWKRIILEKIDQLPSVETVYKEAAYFWKELFIEEEQPVSDNRGKLLEITPTNIV
ncbi:MAG: B12-binding domain-containing radical SAM protein [Promethearchaeota archaeon]